MAYATTNDVQEHMPRQMSSAELTVCQTYIKDAAVIIDTFNADATLAAKNLVTCRMVVRALGDGEGSGGYPIGATQGSMSGLGYSQSWTLGAGANSELYLGKLDKKILGVGNKIGSRSPIEDLVPGRSCG